MLWRTRPVLAHHKDKTSAQAHIQMIHLLFESLAGIMNERQMPLEQDGKRDAPARVGLRERWTTRRKNGTQRIFVSPRLRNLNSVEGFRS